MLKANLIASACLTFLSACATFPSETKSSPLVETMTITPFTATSSSQICNSSIDHKCAVISAQPTLPVEIPLAAAQAPDDVKKYRPLIYGAPKPLICSREYAAHNHLENRPNLQVMWEHYLYDSPKGVWAEVGGAVEINGCLPEDKGGWRNACTVRLSHMLNKADHKIPYLKGKTVSGGSGDQYFFRLDDIQDYIEYLFGPADLDFKDASGQWIDIPNEPGLLILKFPGAGFTGHTTLWNGAGTVDGTDVVGFRVLYWKLPCFIPPDRKKISGPKA